MKQVRGNELSEREQKKALARFVHRFTKDHKPQWALRSKCKVQFASDADWLANTLFWIKDNGELSEKHRYCQSNPTWPDKYIFDLGASDGL